MTLPGPSRTIIVEPIEVPASDPVPNEEPAPEPEQVPDPDPVEPEREPART